MEYVVVKFRHVRDVFIDDQVSGKTGDTLLVGEGHHVFDLGRPRDYLPQSREVLVQDTTEITPLIIKFAVPGSPV